MISISITTRKTARCFFSEEPASKHKHLIFMLHGYAQLADDFLNSFGLSEGKDILLAAPEGTHRFYPRAAGGNVGASWMTKLEREADTSDNLVYLDSIEQEVIKLIHPDAKIHILGFSQGAATAFRWAVHRDTPPASLILWGGPPPDTFETDRMEFPKFPEIFIVQGKNDRIVTARMTGAVTDGLQSRGLNFRTLEFDGGHEIRPEVFSQILGQIVAG